MDLNIVNAISCLNKVIEVLPEDDTDATHIEIRNSLVDSVKALRKFQDIVCERGHNQITSKLKPGEVCTCLNCRADEMFEVLHNLTKGQMIDIIVAEKSVFDKEPDLSNVCKLKHKDGEDTSEYTETHTEDKSDINECVPDVIHIEHV